MGFEAYPITSSNDSQCFFKGEFRSISIHVPQKEFGMSSDSASWIPGVYKVHMPIILERGSGSI